MAAAKTRRKLTTTGTEGKWKTFGSVKGLMQYVPSGKHFARVKVNDIVKRASLETDVFTVVKDRPDIKRKEL